ncbi:amino acid ABC transporter substrate-binding protein [Psychrilyobacter sp.]|uniref:amino acid ABC transporter substrate-binding protein n=1 Tax=Psychrilyobacter sp. TaxID=2586924 RepID=UPI00301667EC
MKKIFITLILILAGVQSFAFSNEKGDTLTKIKKDGYFTVGLDDTFAPMGFRGKNGEIIGFDIDLAKEAARKMGVEVRFKPGDWDGIIFELRSKKIDMVWNGMTITENRKKQIAFSKPYFSGEQIVVTKSGSDIQKISDLSGKTVGVQLGSSSYFALEKNPVYSSVKDVKKYGSNVEALLDLEAGRIQAIIIDSMVGKYYIAKKEKKENKDIFSVVNDPLAVEYMGVGMRKEDRSFVTEIDRVLDEMQKDGSYKKIYEKWFGRRG